MALEHLIIQNGSAEEQPRIDATVGAAQMKYFKLTTGAESSYILKSDGSGNASWQADDFDLTTFTPPITYSANTIGLAYTPNLRVTSTNLDTAQNIKTTNVATFAGLTLTGTANTKPVNSSDANTTFGIIEPGVERQNNLGYDALLHLTYSVTTSGTYNISTSISANTGATLVPIIPDNGLTKVWTACVILPRLYYIKTNAVGTFSAIDIGVSVFPI